MAVVQADEGELRRQGFERLERALGMVADRQRDALPAQHRVHLIGEPGGVAELEGVAPVRERGERARQALVVALEPFRQLP